MAPQSRGDSGGISRRAALALISGGGLLAVSSSGAFDQVEGQRPFELGVGEDAAGLLGIDIKEPTGQDGETVTLIELKNQTGSELSDIDADFVPEDHDYPVDPDSLKTPRELSAGDSGTIDVDLSCSGESEESISIEISASGPEQSIGLTRSVEVTCTQPERGVCEPRNPPGCIDDTFPAWPGTDCSVVKNVSSDIDETITGGIDIGGAVDIETNDEVEITHRGSVTDYFRIATTDEIEFEMAGGASIGGPLQLSTTDEVETTIRGDVGGGVCVDGADELDVTVNGGGVVDGEMSLESSEEVDVDLGGNASIGALSIRSRDEITVEIGGGSEIDGNVDIDTQGEVTLTLDGNERIRGDVSITTNDEVEIELGGSSSIEGNVTVTTADEVEIELGGNSSIGGDVEITTGDEVEVELGGSSSISGNVTINESDDIDISGCRNIAGDVTPETEC